MKYYKTAHSEDDQYFLYDIEKEYGFFFNKWGVYGRAEQNSSLCDLVVSEENFFEHFNKYIEDQSKGRRELIKVIYDS